MASWLIIVLLAAMCLPVEEVLVTLLALWVRRPRQ